MKFKDIRALLRRRFHVPKERPIRRTLNSFTLAEKSVFYFFSTIFVLTGFSLLWQVSEAYLESMPIQGGTLVEGVVGNPRFINPILALSEADKNLASLIYSGLVRVTPQGEVVNDLADEVSISENRLVYTVHISDDATFHDGTAVTADDVIFTIQKISDPLIKSPRRGNWDGIAVEKVDEQTVAFTLKEAYTPFIYNLTTGITPRHIWKNVTDDEFSFSQFNTLPIGSGPYQVEKVERNPGGIPDYYQLTPFRDALGEPALIRNMVFRFYPSEVALVEAYNKGEVESVGGVSPELLSELDIKDSVVIESPLPRIFAVFLNQSQSRVLLNKEVRQALELATPKEAIVEQVLAGYGTAIDGPLPAGVYDWSSEQSALSLSMSPSAPDHLTRAQEILANAGWTPNADGVLEKKSGSATITLSFSISTGDAPELRKVALELISAWQKIGASVDLLVFETGELNQSVIRPRNFDALLFGEAVGRDADLYPFWHSSQRNDPGLNIALYANNRADKFLEEARSESDPEVIEENLKSFNDELQNDLPAIFLYSPNFLYVMPEKVRSVTVGSLAVSQDRFLGIRDWYIETDKVWRAFLD